MMESNGGTGMIMPVAPTGGTGFGNGFGGSYDGNGGMSSRGYSRGGNNVVDGLKELMYAAPQEMQGEIQRLIKKLDNM